MHASSAAILFNDAPVHLPHPTLQCALDAGASSELPLFTFHDTSLARPARPLTLGQLRGAAHRYARMLLASGVRPGDRVLVLLKTSATFVEALLGCMLAGAVPVPLPSTFTFGSKRAQLDALSPIAASAQAAALVTSPEVRDALQEATRLRAQLRLVLTPLDLDGHGPTPRPLPSSSGSDPAFIQYTSGTTGHPKGVVISQRALMSNASAICSALALGPETVGASWLPLFHDMGLVGVLLTAIAHPYRLHLLPPESFLFKPRRWLELLADSGATLTAAPNFAYARCVARAEHPEELDLSALRTVLSGAETVDAATLQRFARHCAPAGLKSTAFVPVYGLAEATLAVTFAPLDTNLETVVRGERTLVSVGRPLNGAACSIRDDGGRLLAQGELGEVVVRSQSLMDGYFRDEQASSAALGPDGLRTGDLGFIERGQLFITGRKKDLIIKAGRNIHPEDVELAAQRADELRLGAVAAVAHPNPDTGTEDLVVFAETRERDLTLRQQLTTAIRGEVLASLGVKVDTVQLCRVGALPRTTSGKIKRKQCAQRLLESEP